MKKQTIARITTVILAVLILTLLMSISVFAASTSATVSSSGKVARGDSITFSVKINNGKGIQGIAVVPNYDKSVFELVSGEWVVTGGLMPDFSVENGDGVVAFSPAVDINTTVLKFTLKAKSDIPLRSHTVSADVIVTESNGNSSLTVTGSTVEIQCKHNYLTNDHTYLKSEASCTSPALYYKICSICGDHNTETFSYGEKLPHAYAEQVAGKYLKNAASCTEKSVYYVSCSVCGTKGTDTFESGTAKGHSYKSEWSTNGEEHWHECSECDDKKDVSEHNYENNLEQACNICGYKLCENHDFSTKLIFDDNSHWYECSLCGAKENEATHNWDNGILTQEATEEFSGIKDFSCVDCGAERIELTPVVINPDNTTDNNTDGDNVADKDDNTSDSSSNTGLIIVAVLEGVAIVVLVVLLILKKKPNNVVNESSESNDTKIDQYEDKIGSTNTDGEKTEE